MVVDLTIAVVGIVVALIKLVQLGIKLYGSAKQLQRVNKLIDSINKRINYIESLRNHHSTPLPTTESQNVDTVLRRAIEYIRFLEHSGVPHKHTIEGPRPRNTDVLLWVLGEHREEITLVTVLRGLEGTLLELYELQPLVDRLSLVAPPPLPSCSIVISKEDRENILGDLNGWKIGGVLMLSTYGAYSDRANNEIAAAIVIAGIETELSEWNEKNGLGNGDYISPSRDILLDKEWTNGSYSEESREAIAAGLLDMY